MKWLEIIELRAVESNRELLESHLQQLMYDVDQEVHTQSIRAYRRATIDTDMSIHLCHDSTPVERDGSPLGLRLASSLKEFGLINHRVWIEM